MILIDGHHVPELTLPGPVQPALPMTLWHRETQRNRVFPYRCMLLRQERAAGQRFSDGASGGAEGSNLGSPVGRPGRGRIASSRLKYVG